MTNPDRVDIGLYEKLGDKEYRVGLRQDIDSMGAYVLVKRETLKEAMELLRVWKERI